MKDARRQKQRDLRRAYRSGDGFSLYRHFARLFPESSGPFVKYRKVGPPTIHEEFEYVWVPTREDGKCSARGRSKGTKTFWAAGHYQKVCKFWYEDYRYVKEWEDIAGQHFWDNRREEWIAAKIGGIDHKLSSRWGAAHLRRMHSKSNRRRTKMAIEKAIRDDDLSGLSLPHLVGLCWAWD